MWVTSVTSGTKVVGLPCLADKVLVYDVESDSVQYKRGVPRGGPDGHHGGHQVPGLCPPSTGSAATSVTGKWSTSDPDEKNRR